MQTRKVYQERGYKNRTDYLRSLAEKYGIAEERVFVLGDIYEPEQDFNELVEHVRDMAGVDSIVTTRCNSRQRGGLSAPLPFYKPF